MSMVGLGSTRFASQGDTEPSGRTTVSVSSTWSRTLRHDQAHTWSQGVHPTIGFESAANKIVADPPLREPRASSERLELLSVRSPGSCVLVASAAGGDTGWTSDGFGSRVTMGPSEPQATPPATAAKSSHRTTLRRLFNVSLATHPTIGRRRNASHQSCTWFRWRSRSIARPQLIRLGDARIVWYG